MSNNNESIALSVLDVERKYQVDPLETVTGGKGIVTWGADNQLPVLYRNCYNGSSSLKAIVDGTVSYALGDDIQVSDNAAYWREKVNRKGMTVRQFLSKIFWSHLVYGGYAIQVIYNKLGLPVELYPLDFARCRTNEDGTKIYYAKKWTRFQTKAEEYDAWDPKNIDMTNPTQIYYRKGDNTTGVYPLPPYAGALYDTLTEIECSKYSLNSVAKGFSARYLVQFPSGANLTDEQKKGIEDAMKNKFTGSDTDSNFMLYYRNGAGEDDKIEVTKIESDDTPEKFLAIKDNARSNIFVAMRCTPLLFGLPNASNGFSTQEYSDSFKLYQKTVVSPIQDMVLESFSEITGTEDGIHIVPFSIDFSAEEE